MLNIIIFGTKEEYLTLLSYAEKRNCLHSKYTDVYDTFLSYLSETAPKAIFILMDGAFGMEGVIAVKNLYPHTPVVWISNDKGFGIQSYRLGCAFFAEKPLTKKKVEIAFERITRTLCDDKQIAENRFANLDDRTVQKISNAKTADELIATAKKYGVTIKKEEAENYFHYLADQRSGELDDDTLQDVSAGTNINHFKLFFDASQEILD